MIVSNMNLHEVYADLMGEMNKLESEMSDVQREAIFEECMKDIDNLNR